MKKFAFLLLCIVLVEHSAQSPSELGNSQTKKEDEPIASYEAKPETLDSIYDQILADTEPLDRLIVTRGIAFSRDILNDTSVLNSEAMQDRTERFSQFLRNVQSFGENYKIGLSHEFLNIVKEFRVPNRRQATTQEDLMFENLLKMHHFEQLEIEFCDYYEKLSSKFNKLLDDYFASLTEDERTMEPQRVKMEHYLRLKKETVFSQLFKMFGFSAAPRKRS